MSSLVQRECFLFRQARVVGIAYDRLFSQLNGTGRALCRQQKDHNDPRSLSLSALIYICEYSAVRSRQGNTMNKARGYRELLIDTVNES